MSFRVVFSSTVARNPRPISTAAMSREQAMAAFTYQARATRFSVWGGDQRMRVVDEQEWQAIRAMADRGAT